uniref:Uncharacterized protein MANES_09G022000 n=1 Tax=Rhizophora mucronata TaxID=61149 RepID=A0A2P2KZ71_RHIMU
MACSNTPGGCQSNCHNNVEEPQDFVQTLGNKNTATTTTTTAEFLQQQQKNLCVKCKANPPIAAGGGGGDEGRFCGDCFRSNLYAKFRLAVTSHAMITPSDNVLVAFSGGPSSRVALQFVHEMQQRAQKNFDANKDRSLPVFGVGVTVIDESTAYPIAPNKVKEAIQEIRVIVSNLAPPIKQLHVVPIEDVYASNLIDGKDRLEKLLNSVNDATGKEDLLLHLRILTLQKVAMQNGYNRVILGSCTSRIACHVISATVKGQGYSLSADIQYVDARWEIPIVLPLLGCTAQELNLLCCIDGLKTVKSLKSPPFGINALVSSFVSLLQVRNIILYITYS